MSDSRTFVPTKPTPDTVKLRCPKDDGHTHFSIDVRPGFSIAHFGQLPMKCWCGEVFAFGEGKTPPTGPVTRSGNEP